MDNYCRPKPAFGASFATHVVASLVPASATAFAVYVVSGLLNNPAISLRDLALAVGGFGLAFRIFHATIRNNCKGLPLGLSSRFVSCCHATGTVALALTLPEGARERAIWSNVVLATSLGYLTHDSLLMLAEPSLRSPLMLLHHAAFALLVGAGASSYPEHTAQALMSETAVPFLTLGWALRHNRQQYPRVAAAVALGLIGTFAAFRVRTFSLLTLEAARLQEWAAMAALIPIAGLNWIWFGQILRKTLWHRAPARSPAVAL